MENNLLREEVDQVILHCIKEYGYDAIPYDFSFIQRYKLFTAFFLNTEMNKESAAAGSPDTKNTILSLVLPHIKSIPFTMLSMYYKINGIDRTKELLYQKDMYFQYFMRLHKQSLNYAIP